MAVLAECDGTFIRRPWIYASLVIVALAPEASFLLVCVLFLRLGVLSAGLSPLLLTMLGFGAAISALLLESLNSPPDFGKLRAIRLGLISTPLKSLSAGLREFLPRLVAISILLYWMATENVALVSLLGGAGWSTVSARVYDGAKKVLEPVEIGLSASLFSANAALLITYFAVTEIKRQKEIRHHVD
jgi:hypothetical protein